MDSQATATQQTTLIDAFGDYRQAYSEFIPMIIDLHNYNNIFLEFKSVRSRPGLPLRKHLRNMREHLKRMIELSQEAQRNHLTWNPPKLGTPLKAVTKTKRRRKLNAMGLSKPDSNRTPK